MSLLVFTARSYQLQAQKHTLNFKLYELRQSLLDLQKYSASIADGVSPSDLAQTPSSLFGRMVNYSKYANAVAIQGTEQKFSVMQSMGAFNNVDATQRAQYEQMIKSQLYEQERARAEKVETKLLDLKEREINAQIKKYEDQLAQIEAEEKTVNDAKSKAIQDSAPRYVA